MVAFLFSSFSVSSFDEGAMPTTRISRLLAANLAFVAALALLGGCTVYGVKNPPTLKNTTSAEQYERILWANVRDQKWPQIVALLAPNVVYAVSGKVLGRAEIVPYLQAQKIRDFSIVDMVIKPNGPDMTLSYTIQFSSPGGATQSFLAVSVWQQVGSNWTLIVHTQNPNM
jgi:hypothetical protein